MRLALQHFFQRKRDMRLADSRLAGENDDLALALGRAPPSTLQDVHLFVAAERVLNRSPVAGGKAAFHFGRLQHLPGGHRFRQSLERNETEIAVLELPGGDASGVRADHHRARLGEGLQASG